MALRSVTFISAIGGLRESLRYRVVRYPVKDVSRMVPRILVVQRMAISGTAGRNAKASPHGPAMLLLLVFVREPEPLGANPPARYCCVESGANLGPLAILRHSSDCLMRVWRSL